MLCRAEKCEGLVALMFKELTFRLPDDGFKMSSFNIPLIPINVQTVFKIWIDLPDSVLNLNSIDPLKVTLSEVNFN